MVADFQADGRWSKEKSKLNMADRGESKNGRQKNKALLSDMNLRSNRIRL